jgi:hypothetical protein
LLNDDPFGKIASALFFASSSLKASILVVLVLTGFKYYISAMHFIGGNLVICVPKWIVQTNQQTQIFAHFIFIIFGAILALTLQQGFLLQIAKIPVNWLNNLNLTKEKTKWR